MPYFARGDTGPFSPATWRGQPTEQNTSKTELGKREINFWWKIIAVLIITNKQTNKLRGP
jgi:hypothetical protein